MSKLLEIALSQIGTKEVAGDEHNATIVNYAKEAGFKWVNDDETAWCSIFMNWCAQKADLHGSKEVSARSWLTTGNLVITPEPGDVVVYWREDIGSWKGHVGLFMGFDQSGNCIYTLGGNQGNQVSITEYPSSQLLGFRRLQPLKKAEIPSPTLRRGNLGERVKQLQDALKLTGFRVGTTDGIFGIKTEEAVKVLQTTEQLTVDGVYGTQTANKLEELLKKLIA